MQLPDESKTYYTTAVKGEKSFEHFGIHPSTCSLYGKKPEDIVDVEIKISSNQTKPQPNQKTQKADYWGWWKENDQRFSLIYSQFFLLDMCFVSGTKAAEEVGHGKAYRIVVKEKKEICR